MAFQSNEFRIIEKIFATQVNIHTWSFLERLLLSDAACMPIIYPEKVFGGFDIMAEVGSKMQLPQKAKLKKEQSILEEGETLNVMERLSLLSWQAQVVFVIENLL